MSTSKLDCMPEEHSNANVEVLDTYERDGNRFEVVYNHDSGLVHSRKPFNDVLSDIVGDEDTWDLNDDNTVGISPDASTQALDEAARRSGRVRVELHVTPQYLREFAEQLEEQCQYYGHAVIHVANDLPLIGTCDEGDNVVLTPRMDYEGDMYQSLTSSDDGDAAAEEYRDALENEN